MKKLSLFVTVVLLATLFSCGKRSRIMQEPSGRANEVLVVADDGVWKSAVGDSLKAMLTQEVAGIPWVEPLFDVSRVARDGFSDMLKPARNVVEVEISSTFTAPKVTLTTELYSRTQAYIRIQAASNEVLKQVLGTEGNKILSFIYKAEKERIVQTYAKFANATVQKQVLDSTGIGLLIPQQFSRTKFAENFVWLAGGNYDASQYLVIYSVPYASAQVFTKEGLVAMRDSMMKINLPGENNGSYMATVSVYPPEFKEVTVRGRYCAELRGLWETKGDMMGGPFVSRSFVDEARQRVVTVEGFVYAPQLDKRNMMRQLEAYISTAKLPTDTVAEESIFISERNSK